MVTSQLDQTKPHITTSEAQKLALLSDLAPPPPLFVIVFSSTYQKLEVGKS